MIVRLVKMNFRTEEVEAFKNIFLSVSDRIRGFDGCRSVELLQDANDACTFFTRSIWLSEDDLNNYRTSELFKETWKKTKAKFASAPQAWTTVEVEE